MRLTEIFIMLIVVFMLGIGTGAVIEKMSEHPKTFAETALKINAEYICDNPKLNRVIK